MREIRYKSMLKRYAGNPLFTPEEFPFGAVDQVFNPRTGATSGRPDHSSALGHSAQ